MRHHQSIPRLKMASLGINYYMITYKNEFLSLASEQTIQKQTFSPEQQVHLGKENIYFILIRVEKCLLIFQNACKKKDYLKSTEKLFHKKAEK